MPMYACLTCGIPTRNGNRCQQCAATHAAKHPTTARGYGADWQRVRRRILDRDQWTCYLCQKILVGTDATVDHVIPLSIDPSRRLDEDNLRACCRSCNSAKNNH
jgi:5-methylcytosine-specific restriction protein A